MVSSKKSKPKWSKDADWLPLSNAKAQVKFWERDLKYAEDYFKYVQKFEKSGFGFYKSVVKLALADIALSQKMLDKALLKLTESENLE